MIHRAVPSSTSGNLIGEVNLSSGVTYLLISGTTERMAIKLGTHLPLRVCNPTKKWFWPIESGFDPGPKTHIVLHLFF